MVVVNIVYRFQNFEFELTFLQARVIIIPVCRNSGRWHLRIGWRFCNGDGCESGIGGFAISVEACYKAAVRLFDWEDIFLESDVGGSEFNQFRWASFWYGDAFGIFEFAFVFQ